MGLLSFYKRITKRYLKTWSHFNNNEYLTEKEKLEKEIFFQALEVLSNEEVGLLKGKYKTSDKPISDEQMANKLDVEYGSYQRQRVKAEENLGREIEVIMIKNQTKLDELKERGYAISQQKRYVRYFLSRWYYLDTNFNSLNDAEVVQIKILYSCLKHLDKQDLEFLSHKYRKKESNRQKSDEICAKELGIKLNEYRNKRVAIEAKLRQPMMVYREKFDKELSNATSLVYGK